MGGRSTAVGADAFGEEDSWRRVAFGKRRMKGRVRVCWGGCIYVGNVLACTCACVQCKMSRGQGGAMAEMLDELEADWYDRVQYVRSGPQSSPKWRISMHRDGGSQDSRERHLREIDADTHESQTNAEAIKLQRDGEAIVEKISSGESVELRELKTIYSRLEYFAMHVGGFYGVCMSCLSVIWWGVWNVLVLSPIPIRERFRSRNVAHTNALIVLATASVTVMWMMLSKYIDYIESLKKSMDTGKNVSTEQKIRKRILKFRGEVEGVLAAITSMMMGAIRADGYRNDVQTSMVLAPGIVGMAIMSSEFASALWNLFQWLLQKRRELGMQPVCSVITFFLFVMRVCTRGRAVTVARGTGGGGVGAGCCGRGGGDHKVGS